MSPDTAARLRERRANRLKDYLAMSGPLGVTHLFLFSRSKVGGNVHMRVALTPRGPTLTYRVEEYTLSKDVGKAQRRARGMGGRGSKGGEYLRAPLVVLNNFTQKEKEGGDGGKERNPIEKQLEGLVTTVWQGIFPAITPNSTPLASVKRILLLNRETGKQADGRHVVSLRHYAITTRESGVSKKMRRFDVAEQRKREKRKDGRPLPNLGGLEDAADYVLGGDEGGYTSASDTEMDSENEVEVLETETHKVIGRKERQRIRMQNEAAEQEGHANGDEEGKPAASKPRATSRVEKRAVKLIELGPRMRLRLIKVEEGICEGKVMWNEFVKKTEEQKDELDARWKTRRAEKEERRRIQRENVARKRGELKKNADGVQGEEDVDMEYGSDLEPEDFDEVDADEVDGGAAIDDEEQWASDEEVEDNDD
jgi:ribosome biogenesis protein SSF1/2